MRYLTILFLIFVFILLGVLIFGHSGKPKTPVVVKNLYDYAKTDVDVQLTIDGPINGNEDHRQIVITVGRDLRTLQINQGYQGTILKSESLGNNSDAYNAFLHALSLSGYTLNRTSKFANEQGQCPLGQRFIYEIINNDDKNMRTWSTNCNSVGSFRGQASLVQQIFQNQFGNYNDYVSDVDI